MFQHFCSGQCSASNLNNCTHLQRCSIAVWIPFCRNLQMLDVPLLWFKVGLHLVQSKPLSSMSLAFCSPWHFGSWSDPLLVTASSCTCPTGRQYHLLLVRDKIGWFGGQYQTVKWLTPRSSFLKQKKVAGSHWPSLRNAEAFFFQKLVGNCSLIAMVFLPHSDPQTASKNTFRAKPLKTNKLVSAKTTSPMAPGCF